LKPLAGSYRLDGERNTIILSVPGKAGRMLKPGDIVGENYELITLLGEGGMGVVFRCRHKIIDREYALKILKPDQVNEQSWQRFQVEGRAIAKLDHHNVVKIFNMGIENNDCPYYVMELLEGQSLENCIGTEELENLDLVLNMFKQLTDGFGYAHSKGVIHRDIKPDNIVLELEPGRGARKTIKIVDFGIAKLVHKETVMRQGLTAAGDVFGTPLYMSPEQSLGREIDHRSDIYSLGCTFFKILTGKFPFLGQTAVETVMMHQTMAAPRLSTAAGDKNFAQPLEEIVHKMLAKNPQHRYQSMEEVGRDIERLQKGKTLVENASLQLASPSLSLEHDTTGGSRGNTVDRMNKKHLAVSTSLLIAITLIMLLGVGVFASSMLGKKSSVTAKKVEVETSAPPGVLANKTDLAADKLKKCFADFKTRSASFKLINGSWYVTYFFPETEIGEIVTLDNFSIPAKGATRLAVRRPMSLKIRRGRDRIIWENPDLLKKIDLNEIDGLILSCEDDGLVDTTDDKTTDVTFTVKVLAIASCWKNFNSLQFKEFALDNQVMAAVDKLAGLTKFGLTQSDNSGAELARFAFLRRMKVLNVSDIREVDSVLNALRGSKNLVSLNISDTTPSAQALRQLKSCSELRGLAFCSSSINEAQLVAISELPYLEKFNTRGSTFNREFFFKLKGFEALKTLLITNKDWSNKQLASLKSAFPHCQINEPFLTVNKE